MNYNKITGLAYQGKNQSELEASRKKNGYTSEAWLTFLQAKMINKQIVKGSKGVSIFKGFGTVDAKDKDGKIKQASVPMGFAYVFNENCIK